LADEFWLHGTALDIAFHMSIMSAARNQRLLRMVSDFHILTRILRRKAYRPDYPQSRRRADVLAHHEAILTALEQRDVVASEQAMRHHIQSAKDYHLRAFDWEQRNNRPGWEELVFPKVQIEESQK
jgi:DNA-binding GntR family transcriptional regulator